MKAEWSEKRREYQVSKLPIDIYDMREECRREVDARIRRYSDSVAHRGMNQRTADRRIATMEAVVDLLDKIIVDWEKRDGQRPALDGRHDAQRWLADRTGR